MLAGKISTFVEFLANRRILRLLCWHNSGLLLYQLNLNVNFFQHSSVFPPSWYLLVLESVWVCKTPFPHSWLTTKSTIGKIYLLWMINSAVFFISCAKAGNLYLKLISFKLSRPKCHSRFVQLKSSIVHYRQSIRVLRDCYQIAALEFSDSFIGLYCEWGS